MESIDFKSNHCVDEYKYIPCGVCFSCRPQMSGKNIGKSCMNPRKEKKTRSIYKENMIKCNGNFQNLHCETNKINCKINDINYLYNSINVPELIKISFNEKLLQLKNKIILLLESKMNDIRLNSSKKIKKINDDNESVYVTNEKIINIQNDLDNINIKINDSISEILNKRKLYQLTLNREENHFSMNFHDNYAQINKKIDDLLEKINKFNSKTKSNIISLQHLICKYNSDNAIEFYENEFTNLEKKLDDSGTIRIDIIDNINSYNVTRINVLEELLLLRNKLSKIN